ncbi:DUF4760 domain-containing protein [Xanthomonas euvesicatoria pv. physalidis]|uniref:DUF4760 domain-containing protein n=1 Tax=Xanthomonas euvesicatoria TaxID=456327 RepID=UPI001C43E83A|nr:DUF4760 domain-containing protein [Xanthomonas euvesicatoria]MBV6687337.1 DUF4760 domain-containing protein [Xanthomonas euvesicatoria pv. physalidis]
MERNPNAVLSHLSGPMKLCLMIVALMAAVCVGLDVGDYGLYEELKHWVFLIIGGAFVVIMAMAVRRCADKGAKSIGQVCFWSIVLLALTLSLLYMTYFMAIGALIPPGEELPPYGLDKLLNIPPVIAAMWAAGLGWYVHFQATAKAHRTNNAWNLLTQTRTSKEFVQRAEAVARYVPHGAVLSEDDLALAEWPALHALESRLATLQATKGPAAGTLAEVQLKDEISKSEALLALRYMLNFYEFMAVGIEKNDLDDHLLYDSLGVHVPSIFRRAEPYVRKCQEKDKETLAFSALEPLVERWERQCKRERELKAELSKR